MNANSRNLLYFENGTMAGLYADLEAWQTIKKKRLLSLSIEKDRDKFCCIALSNPSEVIISTGSASWHAQVDGGALRVKSG